MSLAVELSDIFVALIVGGVGIMLGVLVTMRRDALLKIKQLELRDGPRRKSISHTQTIIENAGLGEYLTPNRLFLARVVVGVGGFFILSKGLGILIAIALGVVLFFVPPRVVLFLSNRRQKKLAKDLVFLLRYMLTLLRAGNSLEQAIDLLAGRYAPDSYRPVMNQISRDLRGAGLREAMMKAKETISNPTFDRLVGFFLVNTELGAELTPLLGQAQESIEAKEKMVNELNIATAQTKMGAYFVPIALGGLILGEQLLSGSSGYWAPYYTLIGQAIELTLFGVFGIGFYGMLKLLSVPPEERINYYVGGAS